MALAKFSKFKKERAVIKEARSKEMKIKKFNKLFNEKLAAMGVSSVADLSEDQVNKLLSSLATEPVNEARTFKGKEIFPNWVNSNELKGIIRKESDLTKGARYALLDLGLDVWQAEYEYEGKVGPIHIFKSTAQGTGDDSNIEFSDRELKDAVKNAEIALMEATESVNEDRMREIEKDGIIAGTPKDAGQEAEVAKKHTFTSPQAPDQEAEAEADAMKAEESEEVDEAKVVEGDEIKSDKEFDDYADTLLKKAHPDDYDEAIAKKVKDGLKKKYDGDYGAMVGALSSGFGG
jgi:hypothetical protein